MSPIHHPLPHTGLAGGAEGGRTGLCGRGGTALAVGLPRNCHMHPVVSGLRGVEEAQVPVAVLSHLLRWQDGTMSQMPWVPGENAPRPQSCSQERVPEVLQAA